MRVFLIHGMGRTSASMALLARRLRTAGHEIDKFGYFVSRDALEDIAASFAGFVETRTEGQPFAVVAHSLGNVITRMALPRWQQPPSHFVMLAPPNQPPAMARALDKHVVYRKIFHTLTQDAGKKLLDAAFFEQLPIPDPQRTHTLIIAGTRGPRFSWTPWSGAPTDSVVGVEETRLPGLPVLEVPAVHTFIMNDADVARRILELFAEEARSSAATT